MNQTEQMREALQGVRREIESLTALQNGTVNHVVKGACGTLDRVLQALNHTPDTGKMVDHVGDANKMVRLTEDDIQLVFDAHMENRLMINYRLFANAIMDAMIKKNGG